MAIENYNISHSCTLHYVIYAQQDLYWTVLQQFQLHHPYFNESVSQFGLQFVRSFHLYFSLPSFQLSFNGQKQRLSSSVVVKVQDAAVKILGYYFSNCSGTEATAGSLPRSFVEHYDKLLNFEVQALIESSSGQGSWHLFSWKTQNVQKYSPR